MVLLLPCVGSILHHVLGFVIVQFELEVMVNVFSSPADLETYTNGMYGYIGASYSDTPSDNMLYPEDTDIYKMMRGEYRADNIGKWSWSNIRTVNFMLARTGRVE